VMKLFPAAALGGTAWLKALAPVFPGVAFCPTGGIDEASAAEYLASPSVPPRSAGARPPSDSASAQSRAAEATAYHGPRGTPIPG
jgi:2-dehydro-3-deoxyphosphogluconate aldolase/(4S)-4-hydroxy-2-oxoglutarate aldolase